MNHFRFRAELPCDVDAFEKAIPAAERNYSFTVEKHPIFPDCYVDIHCDMSLERVIEIMAKVVDSHVMRQTINYAESYTGERMYKRIAA